MKALDFFLAHPVFTREEFARAMGAGASTVDSRLGPRHIQRCSHWTQQEKPDEVNRLILAFIADLR